MKSFVKRRGEMRREEIFSKDKKKEAYETSLIEKMRGKNSFPILFLILCSLAIFFQSCSCGCGCGCETKSKKPSDKNTFRIGIDPSSYPQEFKKMEPYIFGFTEELLQQISKEMDINFIRLQADIEDIIEGLQREKYEGAISTLAPFSFRKDRYRFSNPILITAPVLVVKTESTYENLSDLKRKSIGVLENSASVELVQKYPDMLVKTYQTYGKALNALFNERISGVLIPHLFAIGYLEGIYFEKLRMVNGPLTEQAIRLITLKEKEKDLIPLFNKGLERLEKRGKLEELKRKWKLDMRGWEVE